MILHGHCELRCILIEDISKVNLWRLEGHGIDREAAADAELDWEDLICSGHLDRDPHREFIVRIRWCVLVIFANKVFNSILVSRAIFTSISDF